MTFASGILEEDMARFSRYGGLEHHPVRLPSLIDAFNYNGVRLFGQSQVPELEFTIMAACLQYLLATKPHLARGMTGVKRSVNVHV